MQTAIAIICQESTPMFPFNMSSLATVAVAFAFLGVAGLAAASPFNLSSPGKTPALLAGAEARRAQDRVVENSCRTCRSGAVDCSCGNKKAPLQRAQAPSFAPFKPPSCGSDAAHDEKLRFTHARFAIGGVVANSNKPATPENRWTKTPPVTLVAEVGDAQKGLSYAQQVCSVCHNVLRTDSPSPNAQAPAFKKVANTPGMSITALTVWSRTSHPTMPNLVIEPTDMDNLIAYILSLRDR
jgi:mono/diheme cytochrome c family protein